MCDIQYVTPNCRAITYCALYMRFAYISELSLHVQRCGRKRCVVSLQAKFCSTVANDIMLDTGVGVVRMWADETSRLSRFRMLFTSFADRESLLEINLNLCHFTFAPMSPVLSFCSWDAITGQVQYYNSTLLWFLYKAALFVSPASSCRNGLSYIKYYQSAVFPCTPLKQTNSISLFQPWFPWGHFYTT